MNKTRRVLKTLVLFGFLFSFLCFISHAEAAQIKRVQSGVVNFDTWDISASVNITPVDMSKTIILLQNTPGNSTNDQNFFFTAQFESSSTIQINRAGAAVTNASAAVAWQVIEFSDGVRVQRGISSIGQGIIQKKIILASDTDFTKAVPIIQTQAPFTNTTTTQELFLLPSFITEAPDQKLQLDRYSATSTKTVQITWQIIEFLTDATVQTGTASLPAVAATPQTVNQAITGVTNPLLFNYFTFRTGTTDSSFEKNYLPAAEFTGSSPYTNIQFTRYLSSGNANTDVSMRYYVVNLTNPSNFYQANSFNYPLNSVNSWTISSSGNNGGLAQIVTSAANTLATGDRVTISGHTVSDGANNYLPYDGYWTVMVINNTTFTLNSSTYFGYAGAATGYVVKVDNVNLSTTPTAIDTTRTVMIKSTRGNGNSKNSKNDEMGDYCVATNLYNSTTTDVFRNYMTIADIEASTTVFQSVEFCPLTIKTPNGGEVWTVGSTQNITWKHASALESGGTGPLGHHKANIDLSTDGGATFPLNIITGCDVSLDTYAWTIPATIGVSNLISTQLQVKITDTDLAARNYDTSNANFQIKGTLTLTSPVGGEVWFVGDATNNITWNNTGNLNGIAPGTLKIKLSTDGGVTYPIIVATVAAGSGTGGTYNWNPIPDQIGNNRRIQVVLDSDSTVSSSSPANFYIKGKLTLTAPIGGETWPTLTSQNITWNKAGTFATVSLYYSTNSGGDGYANTIATAQPAGTTTGSYAWTVPVAGLSTQARVKIVSDQSADLQVSNTSPANFNIVNSIKVTSPDAGTEVWLVGESHNITWTIGGSIANVKIEYSTDGGTTYPAGNTIIASTSAASLSYAWTIPDAISDTCKVRISDVLNPGINNQSTNNFKIKGKITVTAPNGGEVYPVASSQIITWQKYGTLGNVNIKYSTDGGVTFPNTIASGISASALNYTWNPIPDNISSTAKVRVELISDPSNVFGVSTANFAIKGSLTLTAPTGGQSFSVGATTTITWTKQGTIGNVQLIYSTDGGTTYPIANTIVSGLDPVTGTPYNWTIPDAIGTQLRVKVCLVSDSTVYSTSTSNFSIKGSLTITSPSGVEKWGVGTSQPITWIRNGASLGNVRLDYSKNGGLDAYPYAITALVDSAALTYPWTIPDAIGNQVKIKITSLIDASINNVSTGTFSIIGRFALNAPSGGETWYVGISQNITWTTYGTVDKVNLYYSTNGGALYSSTIVSAATNVNAWSWTVPDAIGTQTRVKVESFYDSTVYAASAANFTVKGRIILTSPNGGEAWTVGATQNITWTPYGSIGNVDIYYSTDGGTTYPAGNKITPLGGVAASLGTYAWTVPDAIGTNLKVKIISITDSTVTGESAAVFTIRGSLTVTAPNGGETFYVGDSTNITWTKTGTLGNVELRYSIDGGLTYPVGNVIATGVLSTATPYAWTVPDAIGTQLRVRVLLLSDPGNVFDDSNANFTIKGKLFLSIPNGGEAWEVGASKNITWTKAGSIANVKLGYSTDGGTTYPNIIIASTPAAVGSYTWTIPDAIGTSLKVKITDVSDATVSTVSAATFTIKGKIIVTYPNGAETFVVGTAYNILWNSYGTIPQVNLYYSTDAGVTYPATIATAVTNANTYSWTVPDIIGSQVRIKVANFSDAAVFGNSTANFTVNGSITLTYPSGGQALIVGQNANITWTKTGSLGNVKILYSTDGGATYPDPANVIIALLPADNLTYTWAIPDKIGTNLKVKIYSLLYPVISAESTAVFTIKGSLTITAPNGGEVLVIGGSATNIIWTKTGTVGNAKLEYSTDGGTTYPNTITASVDSALLTYSWPIPNNPTTQAKVKITSIADSTVNDASDLNFRIRGSVNLTAPNGGQAWNVNSVQSITWSTTGAIANVKLEYSTDGGVTYPNLIIASTLAASGSYSWTIPDGHTAQARVRITDTGDSTVTSASAADFTIRPTLTVVSPNGGEVWKVNSTQSIAWSMGGTVTNIKLEYSTDGGTTYPYVIIASTPAAALSYLWTIPDTISPTCLVRASDASDAAVNDVSNAYFKIRGDLTVVAPNGGEAWPINSTQNITWTKVGSIANVKLEYSTDAFIDELQTFLIAASVSATTGTPYSWLIPDKPSATVKVRISDVSDSTVLSKSISNFSIKGSLWISAPNGGEVWVVGATNNITWTKFGSISNVELRYSTDGGITYPVGNIIIASTPAATLTYSWTIPDAIGTQLRVKVTDAGDASVFAASAANFSIKGSVTLTSPVGGETWIVGENRNITWTRTGSFANVKLEYSTNGFLNELQTTVITASTLASPLTYAWTVPDAIGTNLKVRISDAANATVTSVSTGAFTIKGKLAITSPNGAETWIVGQSQNISWTRTGSIANVKLEYSTDAGVTYPNVIIASTSAVTGTYAWTIPDAIGIQLRVRITDASDATVFIASAANFNIKGSLAITSPAGGEAWVVGSVHDIAWTKTGTISTVKLEYSTNAFVDELATVVIVASTDATGTPAGTYKYAWTIPDAISSTVKVRITNTADATVTNRSATNFKITGGFTLTAPNGTEQWTVGTIQTVTWSKVGSVVNAKLEYSTNGGTSYPNIIIASTPAAGLSYAWTIPDAIGIQVKVKISDASDATVFSASGANFTILGGFTITAPAGGEVWTVGESRNITWTTAGSVANVKLEYSTDGGTTYPNVIIATTPNTGAYAWTVPDNITTSARIKVSDVANANAFKTSAANFKIRGSLTITAPNGGEAWPINSTQNITWTKVGSIANVKLEYSTDAFIDELQT
ncbi:MAG: hypothetical protein PHG87_02590, partial [Candidatus Omnitrophica bacterium]|nr:hypothetical protein [Candidatus Omnitrophota bacterium]